MRMHAGVWMVAVAAVLLAGNASAKSDWKKVADLTPGGDAKEVSVNREASAIRIVCQSGSVIINTVVVRSGEKKTPHTIGARLGAKERRDITLDGKVSITGLRISDGGEGKYTVYVK